MLHSNKVQIITFFPTLLILSLDPDIRGELQAAGRAGGIQHCPQGAGQPP